MKPDLTPLPLDENGNGARLRTLVFDSADAPMLKRAMSLAAATAMMSGGTTSIQRLKHYQAEFERETHPGAKFMRRETDVTEIAIIATAVPTWSVHRLFRETWSKEFTGVVTVGTRRFESEYSINEAQFEAIIEMLTEVLPLSCERVDAEDVPAKRW